MKRILALSLATMLMVGFATIALAADNAKITGMAGSLSLGHSNGSGDNVDLGEVSPQDGLVEYVYLYDTMFTWDNHTPDPENPTKLTASQISAAKLDVKTNSGSKYVKSAKLNRGEARIEVEFVDELVSVKEQDFTATLHLTANNKRQSDSSITFSGTLVNPIVEVYSETGTIDISNGDVAEAQEYISKIELEVGAGVTIETRMTNGKKVYAVAAHSNNSSDIKVVDENPDIDTAIVLKSVNLGSTGNKVKFEAGTRSYYVYDGNMNYLGTTKDDLPVASKYYLAINELDAETIAKAATEAVAGDSNTAQIVDSTPDSINDNPGTGR